MPLEWHFDAVVAEDSTKCMVTNLHWSMDQWQWCLPCIEARKSQVSCTCCAQLMLRLRSGSCDAPILRLLLRLLSCRRRCFCFLFSAGRILLVILIPSVLVQSAVLPHFQVLQAIEFARIGGLVVFIEVQGVVGIDVAPNEWGQLPWHQLHPTVLPTISLP